jgi:hypothetical protein
LITAPPLLTGAVVVFVTYSFKQRHCHLPQVHFFGIIIGASIWSPLCMEKLLLLLFFLVGIIKKRCVEGGDALPKASFWLVMMGGGCSSVVPLLYYDYYPCNITSCTSWCSLPWKRNAVSRAGVRCVCPSPQLFYGNTHRFIA